MTLLRQLALWLTLFAMLSAFPAFADTTDQGADPQDDAIEQAGPVDDPGDEPADPEDPADPTDPGDTGEVDEPTYNNPAQAMHAANLAEAAAQQPNPETEGARNELENARDAYDEAKEALQANPDDPAAIEAFEQAEADLNNAREAFAEAVADLTGTIGSDIHAMRNSGMGWGQIAHELGVHPGTLGLGHGKKKGHIDPVNGLPGDIDDPSDDPALEDEIAEVTKRNRSTGWNNGQGVAAHTEKSKKSGIGLAKSSGSGSSSNNGKQGASGGSSKGSSSGSKGPGVSNSGNSGNSGNPGKGNSNKGDKGQGNDKGNSGGKGKDK